MNELAPAVLLIGASLGVATILGTLAWLTLTISQRYQKQQSRY